ncbi:MAG: SOS response-associated peptidase family protein [Alphaproteobacteria bacterium]|nr:SOS response-associated peptidase family protein [Alphaproteobacteria bacterium]MBV9372277.1 SOS response-associated peptidase family protein [Alphaproteobacteria bacterium]MBV9899569.1 SOS response-associated peptidase family protein [Alphaproteobacteria bacterium]
MCNDYRMRVELGMIREEFSQLRIPLRFPEGMPNLEPRDDVRITDRAPIVRWQEEGAELVQRRWSWPGAGGKPVYNFRSDGREFGSGRCLIVTDGFYEFTAPPAPRPDKRKDKWLFTLAGEPWFCIAGLWRSAPDVGEAFTMLTTPPGPDVAPFHNRQVAVLTRDKWADWLSGARPAPELIGMCPGGTLKVERAG